MIFESDFTAKSKISDDDLFEDPTGRYVKFNEILGKGAFKTVYKAFDKFEGIEVAWSQVTIKDALKSAERLHYVYSEIHLMKSLKHDNIIKFYTSWIDERNTTINIITELFTSGNLRLYRKKHKNVDVKAMKSWARQILQGLQYLHGQNPPIIHRDIKCDNIFINGNCGEVKIGDLGLAIVMHPSLNLNQRVVGTPEFMAPELYCDQEYNELVDIYSFGMCMLEMITCDYPYNECTSIAQIYKKVTSGIKPASFNKLNDPEIKEFIEKCIAPASMRLSAAELLSDPFLSTENPKEFISNLSMCHLANAVNLPQSGTMLVDSSSRKVSGEFSVKSIEDISQHDVQVLVDDDGFKLMGQKNEDNTISFDLCLANQDGQPKHVHFTFYLDYDTPISLAEEMVNETDLSPADVASISDLIGCFIMEQFLFSRGTSLYEDSDIMMEHGNTSDASDNKHLLFLDNNSERSYSERSYMSSSPNGFNPGYLDHVFNENKNVGNVGESYLTNEPLRIPCNVSSSCMSESRGLSSMTTTYGG